MPGVISSRTWTEEQVTADKLNAIAGESVFDEPNADSSLEVTVDGKMRVGTIDAQSNIIRASLIDLLYPVGSIYTNASDGTNPFNLFGVGTWEVFGEGRAMIGVGTASAVKWNGSDYSDDGTTYAVGDITGTEDHKLTTGEMPSHSHSYQRSGQNNLSGTVLIGGSTSGPYTNATTGSKGSNETHNNMQPSVAVYLWRRTA